MPFLFAAPCVFLTSAAHTAAIRLRGQSRARSAAVAIALALCIWGLVSSVLAIVERQCAFPRRRTRWSAFKRCASPQSARLSRRSIGEFPLHVELAIGLTDIAFGLSATLLYSLARAGFSADALAVWHMTGVLLIVIPGEIAIQASLPGRLHVFATPPTFEVMLDLPIVLAPSLVVAVFLLLNILVSTRGVLSRAREACHLWLRN